MTTAVLRQTRNEDGTRYLAAKLQANGDIVIEGQDLGNGVERIFGEGIREYEWAWTIRAIDVPKLSEVLGSPPNLLKAFKGRFSGDNAANLFTFLKDSGIPLDVWSRKGD